MANWEREPAYLVLEGGEVLQGAHFGARGEAVGRLVFDTASVGYQQRLTDPDGAGQIVVQTFPCAGNYGVNEEDNESPRAAVRGFVVREWCQAPSNFRATGDLGGFMERLGVVGLCGIDTRQLTRTLRDGGEVGCLLTTQRPADIGAAVAKIRGFDMAESIKEFQLHEAYNTAPQNPLARVALVDFGCKRSFVDSLTQAGLAVHALPPAAAAPALEGGGYDGVVLSPGPEAPDCFAFCLPLLRGLLERGTPLLAAGLGHLLLAQAAGGELGRLPHGHRGTNIPVTWAAGPSGNGEGRAVITTQNHGLYVKAPGAGQVSHTNLSDGTCEGIRYKRAISVQFIPAYEAGDMNTGGVFRDFLALLQAGE